MADVDCVTKKRKRKRKKKKTNLFGCYRKLCANSYVTYSFELAVTHGKLKQTYISQKSFINFASNDRVVKYIIRWKTESIDKPIQTTLVVYMCVYMDLFCIRKFY